jgi:hypothetical protein
MLLLNKKFLVVKALFFFLLALKKKILRFIYLSKNQKLSLCFFNNVGNLKVLYKYIENDQ